jgi:ParB family chromosome partitioning protein
MPKQTITADLAVSELVPYEFQTFKLYQGKKAEALENGVLTPILVRSKGDKHEILSGHNRVAAAATVGLQTVPAVIPNEVSDDEARLIVAVSNLIQRSFADLSHSERAAALSAHYEAVKSQGKRTDLIAAIDDLLENFAVTDDARTSDPLGQKWGQRI